MFGGVVADNTEKWLKLQEQHPSFVSLEALPAQLSEAITTISEEESPLRTVCVT